MKAPDRAEYSDPSSSKGFVQKEEKDATCYKLRVLFIGLVLLLDLTWSKIAPGVEV